MVSKKGFLREPLLFYSASMSGVVELLLLGFDDADGATKVSPELSITVGEL